MREDRIPSCRDFLRKVEMWGNKPIIALANPDGPEAVRAIDALLDRIAVLEGALRDAPELHEYANRSARSESPYGVKSFLDAHQNWLNRARTTLGADNAEG